MENDIIKLEEGSHWFKVDGVINIYFKDGVPHLYVMSGKCEVIDYAASDVNIIKKTDNEY